MALRDAHNNAACQCPLHTLQALMICSQFTRIENLGRGARVGFSVDRSLRSFCVRREQSPSINQKLIYSDLYQGLISSQVVLLDGEVMSSQSTKCNYGGPHSELQIESS